MALVAPDPHRNQPDLGRVAPMGHLSRGAARQ